MALTLSKSGIEQTQTINAWHVTQSIDAFSGLQAYDIILSGSFTLTGSQKINGSISASSGANTVGFFGTASWARFAQTASVANALASAITALDGQAIITGSLTGTNFSLGFNTGYAMIPSGSTSVTLTFSSLNGKTLGVNCFVSVGVSSSFTSSTLHNYPRVNSLTTSQLQFSVVSASNTPIEFFYTIIYY